MARLFLSYSRKDEAKARRFAEWLEREGHDVWRDEDDIGGGASFSAEIERALKDCDAVLVLWSVDSAQSMWVRDEAGYARDAGKLQVVLVNEDLEGARVVAPFLQKHPLKNGKPWLDTANALMIPLKIASLPTTILYDANGKEVLRVDRDLDWTGPEAKALLARVEG